jgi:hypothetical protein
VGPRVNLDGCEEEISCYPLGFKPRTVQSVASRNTEYGIPSPITGGGGGSSSSSSSSKNRIQYAVLKIN